MEVGGVKLPASLTTTSAGPPRSRSVPTFPDTFGLGIAEVRASESCPALPWESEPIHSALFTCPLLPNTGRQRRTQGRLCRAGAGDPTYSGFHRVSFSCVTARPEQSGQDFLS